MALPSLHESARLKLEPTPKWIRARLGGKIVIDSRRAQLVRMERPPVPRSYAFPAEDISDAVPTEARKEVDGHIAVEWDAMDHWYEEAEEVFVHPRDPNKRIDTLLSTREVVIKKDGAELARTDRPVILIESYPFLPLRYYLAHDDADMTRLRHSKTITRCPYKGRATYYDVRIGETWNQDLAWTYLEPLREVEPIRGRIAFFNEKVDVVVDGEREERPKTPFS